MTDKMIEHKSAQKTVDTIFNVLETIDRDRIVCTWRGTISYDTVKNFFKLNFSWGFDWSKLKNQGVERVTGCLIVKIRAFTHDLGEYKIDIGFRRTTETVAKEISYVAKEILLNVSASYEYHLTPHYVPKIEKIPYDEMFAASEKNDTVLVIEGKKVHVNKAFLSYHSDYFRALFSSNFKEGHMAEIPIGEVTYEDFGLLMSTVYPKQVLPTDETSEKLLELADRFLFPFVTYIVEYHLLNNSKMENEKLMWMADAYGMKNLLEKCVRSMDTVEKARKLEKSPEYEKISNDAKAKLFKRILQII